MASVLERLERLEHHNKLLNAWLIMDKDPYTEFGVVREVDRFNKVQYVRIESLKISGEDCIVTAMHIANMSRYRPNAPINTEIKYIFKDLELHMKFNDFSDRAVNKIEWR